MLKRGLWIIIGIVSAVASSYYAYAPYGLENLSFNAGLFDEGPVKADVVNTVRGFNSYYAKFFNTGGDLGGLGEFPAENMIKRRVVQEINNWSAQDKTLVYDKDVFEVESVEVLSPRSAVLVAKEVWFMSAQMRSTRLRASGVKANQIRVRYMLQKWPDGKWRVVEYEVFGIKDDIPPLDPARFII